MNVFATKISDSIYEVPQGARPAEPLPVDGVKLGYVTGDGAEHRVSVARCGRCSSNAAC